MHNMSIIVLSDVNNTKLILLLAENVKNLPELREKALSGKVNCTLINPALVASPLQIAIAANKAANSRKSVTKSLTSELLFKLSISKNIKYSLDTFAVQPSHTSCLVAIFQRDEAETEKIKTEIDGDFIDISSLSRFTDKELVQKTYKISDEELKVSTLEDSVLTRIALKELD